MLVLFNKYVFFKGIVMQISSRSSSPVHTSGNEVISVTRTAAEAGTALDGRDQGAQASPMATPGLLNGLQAPVSTCGPQAATVVAPAPPSPAVDRAKHAVGLAQRDVAASCRTIEGLEGMIAQTETLLEMLVGPAHAQMKTGIESSLVVNRGILRQQREDLANHQAWLSRVQAELRALQA